MTVLAAALGLVMGLVVGALGGGGGVLTVPLLVYLLGFTAQSATTSSIVIVGITALAGTLARLRGDRIDWRTGLTFGALGVPAAFLGTLLNRHVDQRVLLLAFAAVTALAAAAMLVDGRPGRPTTTGPAGEPSSAPPGGAVSTAVRMAVPVPTRRRRLGTAAKIVLSGLVVGFMTGFLGVGGGFLVVPALVIVLRMPVSQAVGTSLLIISLNAVSSMASRLGAPLDLDWRIVVPFTLLAVVGSVLGKRVAERLSGNALTRSFALMLLLVGGVVAVRALGIL
ncbi:hypothetical protein GCM10017691_24610 [Pseudonocardia petroleophila]|uniref:Probable membrane transporter protein n=1 Tax=Pseudonocardia petroleophila TaxID=37331 RepID=A0A7G7MFN9_9PSEU|nr:sulfite exporter TauE/SafE family protein [Pseudonocardia petroleophila]QNG51600.1 sulfite exporter TauE/SafE family protein [Pseudonocardia petroleophila]